MNIQALSQPVAGAAPDGSRPDGSRPDGSRYVVTASDLVRHFGLWQERAARAPVYILHRGRPRHVLTSIDVMDMLCAPHADGERAGGAASEASIEALLDVTDDILLLVDAQGALTALSLAARTLFGGEARTGQRIEQLLVPAVMPIMADAVERVLASGIAEALEIIVARYPDRRFGSVITPYGRGLAIRLEDTTLADDVATLRASRSADHAAILATGGAATAAINLRGYLQDASPSLSALTGLAGPSLATVRFVSLVDIASRAALADAIEGVVTGRGPCGLDATLLVNRASPIGVRIGLAAIHQGSAITGAAAMMLRADAPGPIA